tara:strand:- start:246 stop:545 length:300 start_codon:yes stop_codon:yes gene_type:complete
MALTKMVNGVIIQLTPEEESARNAEVAEWEAGAFDRSIESLRQDRNQKLAGSDWTALSDVTLSNASAWSAHRQSLRDLPAGLTTVEEVRAVVWPTPPAS